MVEDTYYLPITDRDREIFDAIVPPDHYLRRVRELVDFGRFRELLLTRYSRTMGRPPKEPLLLLKLEFIQFQYGLSDREVIAQSQVNMAFRFFLDLSLKSPLPDPSLLSKFRTRLGAETHEQVFQDLVAQAREHGLVKDRLRLKDATHIVANVAIPSTLSLVAQTRDELLAAARPYDPERVVLERAEAAHQRSATADLPDDERLLHRVTHLRAVVVWADGLLAAVESQAAAADPHRERLRAALALAHKVLNDREDPKAPDKVVSVRDADARTGWHHQWFAGYLLDLTEDAESEFVTAIEVLPANADEAADATALLREEEQAQGNDVAALSIDAIGFRGDLLREWTDPEGLNVEVIVPPKTERATTTFGPEEFALNAAGDELTCPAGETTRDRQRNGNDTGWKYRFEASQCAGCPLRGQCLQKPEKVQRRTVIKNDYDAEYRAAREKAQTPEYEATRREHPRVERKLGELARWHGARRARYWGRSKVLIQALLTGWVVNVKRLVRLLSAEAGTVRADLAVAGANG